MRRPLPQGPSPLGREIKRVRVARGYSLRALAEAARVDASGLSRLERGRAATLAPASIARIARVLDVEVGDLYIAAGFEPIRPLPGIRSYLRAKYDLPPAAVEALGAHFDLIEDRYLHAEPTRDDRPAR